MGSFDDDGMMWSLLVAGAGVMAETACCVVAVAWSTAELKNLDNGLDIFGAVAQPENVPIADVPSCDGVDATSSPILMFSNSALFFRTTGG
jgi:phosphoribosylcarboxyaminoimidazole (NCAIR) mutase